MSGRSTLEQGLRAQNIAWMLSILSVFVTSIAGAAEPTTVRDVSAPAKTVKEWVAQVEAATAQVIAIRVVPVENRLQVQLDTADGRTLQATTREEGNTLIAEIANAVLVLPSGQSFRAEKPAIDITEITATQINASTVQIRIVGDGIAPIAEVVKSDRGLVLSVEPDEDASEEEITVTGAGQSGYRVPNASTATRTDTPIRDIPASIQVVPQEVLRDRNVRTTAEAVETVSGVLDGSNSYGAPGGTFLIRGFNIGEGSGGNLRNGFRDYDYYSVSSIGTIEQIEVLKGPASVLFSAQEPGGVINTVTKKPLNTPYYNIAFQAGNYGFYQPSIDFSGPLTADRNVLYRFIASYRGAGSYQDFVSSGTTTIAPSITLRLGERTDLNLSYEYVRYFADNPIFEVPLLSDGSLPPRNFYPAYPSLVLQDVTTNRIGLNLNHRFSENLQVRSNLAIVLNQRTLNRNGFSTLVDDRILTDSFAEESSEWANSYFGQIDLLGKFNTGSISHQLLAGFDISYLEFDYRAFSTTVPDLDILNPNYDIPRPEYSPGFAYGQLNKSYGIYLQDQIALSNNVKLLIGGRYDWTSSDLEIRSNDTNEPVINDGAFSPRVGLVYQPSDTISLYASYSSSFKPSSGFSINPDGGAFKPTRGTQYEVGVKTDFLDRKLSATLAAYHLTRTNVITPDPNNPGFSIQTGEARSQGIELDVAGEILPGWKIVASYAYTDAEVTKDNSTPVGNQLDNVPFNQASLWTTYEIQQGNLRGLGFGLGLFYVGARQGDLANSFEIPSYLRTDAAVYYRRDGFNAAVNIRNLFDVDSIRYSFGRTFIQRDAPLTITGSIGWTF
ncbi:TonB-dependent siderophore receptor [Leptolyngbya sp. AN03gr2]|uniref:TonB-dependent siderophore receptor n=1 Tax=unclassified Leptolyngbya TaxID=2650499 RepID=UPI003D323A68